MAHHIKGQLPLPLTKECYLVGGAAKGIEAHLLRQALDEVKLNDLDFSVNIEPDVLIKHGFKQSMHKKNLKKEEEAKVSKIRCNIM